MPNPWQASDANLKPHTDNLPRNSRCAGHPSAARSRRSSRTSQTRPHYPTRRSAPGEWPPPVACDRQNESSRRSFRCREAFRCHPERTNDPPLPCSGVRPAHAGFYLEHTPPLRRLKHLTDQLFRASGTGHHPGGRRGSQVSDGRRVDSHVASRCDPADPCRMSALPQRHSFPSSTLGFRGAETESSPLPVGNGSSRFGAVSANTHWQALSGLSWLSFSPSAVSADRRIRSRTRSRASPRRELPTPAALNGHRPWPVDRTPRTGFSPASTHHTERGAVSSVVPPFEGPCRPASPDARIGSNVRITPSPAGRIAGPGGDYADEPPSSRTSASPRIRLYGSVT